MAANDPLRTLAPSQHPAPIARSMTEGSGAVLSSTLRDSAHGASTLGALGFVALVLSFPPDASAQVPPFPNRFNLDFERSASPNCMKIAVSSAGRLHYRLDDRCRGFTASMCWNLLFIRRNDSREDGATVVIRNRGILDLHRLTTRLLRQRSKSATPLHLTFPRAVCAVTSLWIPIEGSVAEQRRSIRSRRLGLKIGEDGRANLGFANP